MRVNARRILTDSRASGAIPSLKRRGRRPARITWFPAGILCIACTLMSSPASAQFDSDNPVPAYRDTSLGPEERAADLVARMTLDVG